MPPARLVWQAPLARRWLPAHFDTAPDAEQEQAQQWAGKLDGQDAGLKAKRRKLWDSGAKARLNHAVCEVHLA